jgi:hypothetical protein
MVLLRRWTRTRMALRRFLDQDQDLDQNLMNLNSSATNQKLALLERGGAVYSVQNLQIAPPDWVRPRRPMLERFAGSLKEL